MTESAQVPEPGVVVVDPEVGVRGGGHAQAQPVAFWRVVLGHAHAVADLAGRRSMGPKNPYAEFGVAVPWYPSAWLLFEGPSRKRLDLEQRPV